jgi:hypothetical protein
MGQIKVKGTYMDADSVKDLESAGYEVNYSEKGNYWVVLADDETADEITDSLRGNGWSKIDKNLVKESVQMEDYATGVRDGLAGKPAKGPVSRSAEYKRGYASGQKQKEKAPGRYGESLSEANVSVKVKDKNKLDSVLKKAKKFGIETEVVPLTQTGLSKDGVVVVLTGASEDMGDFISSCPDCVRMKQYRESAIDLALAALTEEKQIHTYNSKNTALAAFNKFKQGHSMIMKKDGKKTIYGIVYGGKPAGWTYV